MDNVTRKQTILVVEDDFDIRALLCSLFESENFAVLSAENGKAALDVLRTAKAPDLILLDLMMPVMDAVEFRKIQEADPKIASVPVLVMSADPNVDVKSLRLGVNEYVKKPLDIERLLSAVERALRRHTALR